MPPPCSTRWSYFTKGIHPNPPASDGRTAGTPHTPTHPCSNPKLFWVQCNFCMQQKNGGSLILDDDSAWMKSREEQMMHHLKNCCAESQTVWEDIIAWKARRKGMDAADMAAGKKRKDKKRNHRGVDNNNSTNNNDDDGSMEQHGHDHDEGSATNHHSISGDHSTTIISHKKARRQTSFNNMEVPDECYIGQASSHNNTRHTTATSHRGKSSEHTKLNATQLRYFHKTCTIAMAAKDLDFSFFEDPLIKELFHIVRPTMVANGQLPTRMLIAGDVANSSTTSGTAAKRNSISYIEKYAAEQVTNDMYRIIRSLRRYEGLKGTVIVSVCRVALNAGGAIPSSTLVCGGELSCRVVPALTTPTTTTIPTWGDTELAALQEVQGYSRDFDVIALVHSVETQLRLTARYLGKSIIGDNQDLVHLQTDNASGDSAMGKQDGVIDHRDQPNGRHKFELHESTGLPHIGSCLLPGDYGRRRSGYNVTAVNHASSILSYRWPMVHFIASGCLLEVQLNLLFKDILVDSHGRAGSFRESAEQAIHAIYVLQQLTNVPSYKAWRESLLMCITGAYGNEGQKERKIALGLLGEQKHICWSRWTPVQRALASLLRIKSALVYFAGKHFTENDFPNELRLFTDEYFWKRIERAETIIRPLVRASSNFVPEKATESRDISVVAPTMADLVHTFCSLYYCWASNGCELAAKQVEKRWRNYEHPWMILAFVLHPGFTQEARCFLRRQSHEDGLFSTKYLSNAILGYAVKYLASELVGEHPLSISQLKRQASEYLDSVESGDVDTGAPIQMKKDWKEYWSYQTSTPELSKFALFLLGITIQSKTTDDVFQDMAALCADIPVRSEHGCFQRSPQREDLKEHLGILKKAAQPLIQKWNNKLLPVKGLDRPQKETIHILSPVERLPMHPPALGMEKNANTGERNNDTFPGEAEPILDTNGVANNALEKRVADVLESTNMMGNQQHITVTQFWIDTLKQLEAAGEDREENDYEQQGVLVQEATEAAEDGDIPQFAVPVYVQATTAPSLSRSRKVRKTYRPEQINFDFMKGWTDTRDQILSPNKPPPEEPISQLKNYRANKLRLADFFDPRDASKLNDENIAQLDGRYTASSGSGGAS